LRIAVEHAGIILDACARVRLIVLAALATSCSLDAGHSDQPGVDAGGRDGRGGAGPDAGVQIDARVRTDAGGGFDAGGLDARGDLDAGEPDAGGPPPPPVHGPQTMSDVHVDQSGEQAWIIHSSVADIHASPRVLTAHLGAYVPAAQTFLEVLDTTGTLGKKILFPASDRLLLVTGRGTTQDVFVTIDTAAHRPVKQHTVPGDRFGFRLSPTGRAVLATNRPDSTLHVVGTESLFDQPLPGVAPAATAAWASAQDVLYTVQVVGDSTQIHRFDLRTADLGQPLAPPVLVATIAGRGGAIAVSPDDRFAAVPLASSSGASLIAMIDLTTGAATTVPDVDDPSFTRDNRVVAWHERPDLTHDLSIVDPASGTATEPLATDLRFPQATALRRHDLVIATSVVFGNAIDTSFLYRTTDGASTRLTDPVAPSSLFERPGHAELWIWEESGPALSRIDLATGAVVEMVRNVDSVDYRAATDDIVIGTFDHSVRLFSMATGQDRTEPFELANPNDAPAPYKLGTE
jgi:hypothetical protein